VTRWHGVDGTDIEVSDDGSQFRWTFDRDGADFLATELHPDATSREMFKAIAVAEGRRRIHDDMRRFGFAIVMTPGGDQ
jgi:hypothetical protein